MNTKYVLVALSFLLVLISGLPVRGQDYTSTNFILREPVIIIEGGQASSSNFQYFSSTGQTVTGEATSTSFTGRSGFLYFPQATSPVLSATAGDGQVSLSWTASIGTLANITNYQVGTATTSGGPYTFESVGNVTSFTKTGLTNGTTYYFVVKADAGTLTLAQSGQVQATPAAPSPAPAPAPAPAPGGGGGGAGAPLPPTVTSVIFSGRAYPNSTVTLLKDAQVAATTIADANANFQVTLTGISAGSYIFSVYSEDSKGVRSSLLTFPIGVTQGAATNVGGMFLAPTIDVDKSEVKRGENIAIFGQSAPTSEITISVASDEVFVKTNADVNGVYLYNFDTTPLDLGQHFTKSKAALVSQISSFSQAIGFTVGTKSVPKGAITCGKADVNCDGKVNLIDFSIAAYWYKRQLTGTFLQTEKDRLNEDGKVDLVDFSIMAYHWTG